jgi:hypothetical protein
VSIEVTQPLIDAIGDGHLGAGIAEGEERPRALGRSGVELLLADERDPAGPIERVVPAAPVPELLGLHPTTHGVEAAVGQRDTWKGSTTCAAVGRMTEYTAA